MFDIGAIVKLMKTGDLPSAAKALGMEHSTIAPGPLASRINRLQSAFEGIARAAQEDGAEVIELSGSPGVLKGKRVRILAVLEAEEKTS